MKLLFLGCLLTVAMTQQSMAVVISPPKINQPQTEVAYYYHGRYYPYHYHGHYYHHRVWRYGRWYYY